MRFTRIKNRILAGIDRLTSFEIEVNTIMVGVFIVFILIYIGLAFHNNSFPKFFEIETESKKLGVIYTETLIMIGEDMSNHWLPNDILYPTVLLDNRPNFQLGELEAVRYATRILRDNLSRMRTTDRIDANVDKAFVLFSNDPLQWIFPAAEGKYKSGVKELRVYLENLKSGRSNFYPRADNLHQLLGDFASLLGGSSSRLANAPRDRTRRLSEETAGDEFIQGEQQIAHLTPWLQIDDNFYRARGNLYVIRQVMVAIKYDFAEVLEIRKSTELVDSIISILDESQFEPLVVVNGDPGSLLANHSLQLQARLEDARQKIRSLQSILER